MAKDRIPAWTFHRHRHLQCHSWSPLLYYVWILFSFHFKQKTQSTFSVVSPVCCRLERMLHFSAAEGLPNIHKVLVLVWSPAQEWEAKSQSSLESFTSAISDSEYTESACVRGTTPLKKPRTPALEKSLFVSWFRMSQKLTVQGHSAGDPLLPSLSALQSRARVKP